MVIRAKDQASRVINSVATSAMGDFSRMQRDARNKSSQLGIDMAQMRTKYDRAILQSRERLFAAQRAGDADEARAAQQRIKRLGLIRDAHALNIRQAQVDQRQQALALKQQHEATMAAAEHQRNVARTGGVMIAFGATMALVGGAGVKAMHSMAMGAVEYQRQATLTQTQLGKQKASVQDLQRISNNVARSVGAPLSEMQGALYDIFSSTDIKVKDSQAVLATFARAAVAGQVSIQAAGSASISIMNGFHKSVGDLNKIMDVQFAAVRLGRMTYDQFAAAIGKAIPSAVAANQSFETLAGSMAFLTRAGLTASQSAISFARLSDLFARGDVPGELKKLGIEAYNSAGKMRPINELLAELAVRFKPLNAAARAELFKQIFGGQGTIQARRFFNLAIEGSAELNRYINEVSKSSGDFGAAYSKMANTTAVQTIVLKNNWELFRNALGAESMPALNRLIAWATKFLVMLNEMEPGQRKLIGNTILWGSVATTAVGAIIALSGAVVVLGAGLKTANLWLTTMRGGLVKYAGETSVATGATSGLILKFAELAAKFAAITVAFEVGSANLKEFREHGLQGGKFVDPATWALTKLGKALGLDTDHLLNFDTMQRRATEASKQHTAALGGATTNSITFAGKTAIVTTTTKAANAALTGNYTALTAAQVAADRLAEHGISPLRTETGKLKTATKESTAEHRANVEQLVKVRGAIRAATPDFRGMQKQVKMTAEEVNKQLRREINAYTNWSTNVQTLIKRGVDPKFIQMLAKRGPEYVAAMASANKTELHKAVVNWQREHGAMLRASGLTFTAAGDKTKDFKKTHAEQVEAARKKHAEKMAAIERATRLAMIHAGESAGGFRRTYNDEIGKLVNVKRYVNLASTFTPPKGFSMHSIVGKIAAGGYIAGPGQQGIIRRAGGGIINMGSGPTSDDVLARLSRGEFVTNARATSKHRGLLEAINKSGLPGFATGGAVDVGVNTPNMAAFANRIQGALNRIGDIVETGIEKRFKLSLGVAGGPLGGGSGRGWAWQIGVLRAAFPGLTLISGFRPGARTHATGAVSYHALGRAVDVPPSMAVFNWIRSHYGKNTRELIFSPAGNAQLHNGAPHMYTGVTRADHWNHVHWAMRNGGYITEPTLLYGMRSGRRGIMGEAGIERVTPTSRDTRPGLSAMGGTGGKGPVNITINTQEVVPEREAQMLGWHLQRRI